MIRKPGNLPAAGTGDCRSGLRGLGRTILTLTHIPISLWSGISCTDPDMLHYISDNCERLCFAQSFAGASCVNTGKENHMKKLLAMIAVLTMTTGLLAGCGGSASSGTASSGTSSAKESAAESAPAETKAESKAKPKRKAKQRAGRRAQQRKRTRRTMTPVTHLWTIR